MLHEEPEDCRPRHGPKTSGSDGNRRENEGERRGKTTTVGRLPVMVADGQLLIMPPIRAAASGAMDHLVTAWAQKTVRSEKEGATCFGRL